MMCLVRKYVIHIILAVVIMSLVAVLFQTYHTSVPPLEKISKMIKSNREIIATNPVSSTSTVGIGFHDFCVGAGYPPKTKPYSSNVFLGDIMMMEVACGKDKCADTVAFYLLQAKKDCEVISDKSKDGFKTIIIGNRITIIGKEDFLIVIESYDFADKCMRNGR